MDDPIRDAQEAAAQVMTRAARLFLPDASEADAMRVRFRADGKGGVFASPYPQMLGLSARTLAGALQLPPCFSAAAPSGAWLSFTPSALWLCSVRRADISPAVLALPPLPESHADVPYSDPLARRFLDLLGQWDPEKEHTLDARNPAFLVRYACRRALQRAGQETADSPELVLLAAACLHELAQARDAAALCRALYALSDAYLSRPAEHTLTARILSAALESFS